MNALQDSPFAKRRLAWCVPWLLLVALFSGATSSVWAVAPVLPVDAAGTHDEVFRVIRQDSVTAGILNGDGTGTVFDYAIQQVGGRSYLRMCLVTADHVVAGTTLGGLGFRNENPQGTFGTNAFDFVPKQSYVKRGGLGVPTTNAWAGGGRDTPDIAFIGVTIDLGNVGGTPATGPGFLNSSKALLLQAAAADAVPLKAIGPNDAVGQFTFHGYGDSGRAPVAADTAKGWNGFEYIHHNNLPNDEQYGILRPLTDTVTVLEFQNAQNGTLGPPGNPYRYEEGLNWFLAAGKSYGLSGDSGAALVDSTNHIVGVFNISEGSALRVNNNPMNPIVAEGVKVGFLESAVALTPDYVNWLEFHCQRFMSLAVPEPSTFALLFVATALLAVRSRRQS